MPDGPPVPCEKALIITELLANHPTNSPDNGFSRVIKRGDIISVDFEVIRRSL
jgi:hypothetical protein